MNNNFQILPIAETAFTYLLSLNHEQLAEHNAVRQTASAYPGFPCRFTLEDTPVGEEVILFPHLHHPVAGPYRSSGPVYVRVQPASATLPGINDVPEMLTKRAQSLRAYDQKGMMVAAAVVEGLETEQSLHRLFDRPEVAEVHVHNARPGCFNCRAIRV